MNRILFISGLVLGLANWPAYANESEERLQLQSFVQSMFGSGNFGVLEKMAKEIREEKSRTESGIWKLGVFYDAFSNERMVEIFGSVDSGGLEALVQSWMKAIPNSPTANLVYTDVLYGIAWSRRGSGYFSHLTDEQIKNFREAIGAAARQLEFSRQYATDDPHWYSQAIMIARDASWSRERFEELITQAVSAEPYYYPIYFSMIEASLPEWGGSVEAIDRVVRFGVQQTSEQDGESFLARGYWYAADRSFGRDLYKLAPVKWADLKSSFEQLTASYPSKWNSNAYARLACLAGDIETGTRLLNDLEGDIVTYGWQYLDMLEPCGFEQKGKALRSK